MAPAQGHLNARATLPVVKARDMWGSPHAMCDSPSPPLVQSCISVKCRINMAEQGACNPLVMKLFPAWEAKRAGLKSPAHLTQMRLHPQPQGQLTQRGRSRALAALRANVLPPQPVPPQPLLPRDERQRLAGRAAHRRYIGAVVWRSLSGPRGRGHGRRIHPC